MKNILGKIINDIRIRLVVCWAVVLFVSHFALSASGGAA